MKERLLDFLACRTCNGEFSISNTVTTESKEILEGTLRCGSCYREFPIVRGVPRFSDIGQIEKEKADTAENFGWQWNKFTQDDEKYADQLLGWLQPVRQEFFKGKMILEGGCGKGRHTRLAHKWGAKEIIGVDLSAAVDSAFEATRDLPNAHIVQADIFNLPLKKEFDYAFSVGVLHHTPDPEKAFQSLSSRAKKGGHISAWVYGKENNKWIIKLVNPVRKSFTSKMGQTSLFQLSKLPTAGVYMISKAIYKPLNRIAPNLAKKLFYNEYLNHLSAFGWREQHNIVFDHLVAPTAFYLSKEEFEKWWEGIGARDVEITWHNENSWCGYGKIR